LFHNPLESTENDVQQDESQPIMIVIEEEEEEEKNKLIQKEAVQTGSVSSIDKNCTIMRFI
jgi:hypothetical protein